jgi:NTP pyrophosphatase (non-canonical NTP hydrolase)
MSAVCMNSFCEICNRNNGRHLDFDDFQGLSMRSFKTEPGLTDQQSKAMLGSIGLAGEVGECTEPVKKWFFHHKLSAEQVRVQLLEEIGDVLWYAACLADAFGLSLQEIAEKNVKKLEERYPERVK